MDSVEVGPNIVGMTNGFGYVWLTQQTPDGGFSVLRVQESFPEQEQGVLTLPTGGPGAITTGHGFVWIVHSGVVGGEGGSVSKVEPESNLVTDVVPVGSGPVAVASTPDAVWVANFTSGTVTRIEL
jgi:DNA-binding beta-propeller fold protein YncE